MKDSEKTYIGWVSSYDIDDDCAYTENPGHCTVGIDIPDISARGKGYSYQALCVFIRYLLEHGESEIYIQTWSGNERMIHIAQKIGFEEYCRKTGIRSVRGGTYDGLTFKLNLNRFKKFSATVLD
jgi:RimJ/RimL family protein N-acetyltransferase